MAHSFDTDTEAQGLIDYVDQSYGGATDENPYAALDGPAPYAVHDAAGTRLDLEAADGTRFTAIDAMITVPSAR